VLIEPVLKFFADTNVEASLLLRSAARTSRASDPGWGRSVRFLVNQGLPTLKAGHGSTGFTRGVWPAMLVALIIGTEGVQLHGEDGAFIPYHRVKSIRVG
jgi:hypothetical protein